MKFNYLLSDWIPSPVIYFTWQYGNCDKQTQMRALEIEFLIFFAVENGYWPHGSQIHSVPTLSLLHLIHFVKSPHKVWE